MQLELKNNAISVHSNLVGATHRNLRLLTTEAKHAILSKILYVCPTPPGIILITNNAPRVASCKLKHVYDENLQVFYKDCGFK